MSRKTRAPRGEAPSASARPEPAGFKAGRASPERSRRVLSGMRPTGKLHLGNFVGALENWLQLQTEYECFFFIADWHALTTDYADTSEVTPNTLEVATDWLAVGLDPARSTLFIQSRVPEHAELHLLFSMLTPTPWLIRNPTIKEQARELGLISSDSESEVTKINYGLLGYPVLQAADILIYRADYVPVGEDQVPHVELTREIARRFNMAYGELILPNLPDEAWHGLATQAGLSLPREISNQLFPDSGLSVSAKADLIRHHFRKAPLSMKAYYLNNRLGEIRPVLPEPQALLTPTPRLPGLDGRRMSKSVGNSIELGESPESIRAKVSTMLTDPQRVRRTDPGRPEICPVFGFHRRFSTQVVIEQIDHECRTAKIGCVDCKALMADHLTRALAPIRERRQAYAAKPKTVWDILAAGSERARCVARDTMQQVREAMKLVPNLKNLALADSSPGPRRRRGARRLVREVKTAP